jgi:CheY-like chemotaxis protein
MSNSDTPKSADAQPICVLIVEDDADSREMLGELIASLGHRALQAADAFEALRHAGESQPDMALIDLSLPEVDGCEVARRLRARSGGESMRLVALTGYSDGATRETAQAAGFDEFVVKPLMPEALAQLLHS